MVLSEENNKWLYQDRLTSKILDLEQKVAMLSDENKILSDKLTQPVMRIKFLLANPTIVINISLIIIEFWLKNTIILFRC